ncbi:fasciclin domain-containing protein [Aggregatimonas sangjinii]|nr:fasciclin domain-containing protein [Aggregatimonas sangjinii]
MKKLLATFLITCLFLACTKDDNTVSEADKEVTQTILDRISESESLSVIKKIIETVDSNTGSSLGESLDGESKFTLFAPINDSDTPLALNIDAQGNLVFSEDELALWSGILKYHLVAGSVLKSSDLEEGDELTTVLGEKLIVGSMGEVVLEDATDVPGKIVRTDILAKNGIIHYVDKVLTPNVVIEAVENRPEANEIREVLESDDALSTLLEAIIALGMEDELFGNGTTGRKNRFAASRLEGATLFAPTNEAFNSLFAELGDEYNSIEDFDTEEEKEVFRNALRFHTAPAGVRPVNSFTQNGEELMTLLDENITIGTQTSSLQVRDTRSAGFVMNADRPAGGNIVHTINIVLRPIAFYDAFAPDETAGDTRNIPSVLRNYPSLSVLVQAIEKTEVSFEYSAELEVGDVNISTFFAPDNEAFTALFEILGTEYNSLDDFNTPEELEILADIILHQHSSSYLCSETLVESGRSQVYPARLINPQVPKFPDVRNEVRTIGDAAALVITIRDDFNREARIKEADIVVGEGIPACAEGVTDIGGQTSLIHITDLVLLKRDFTERLNDL